MFKVPEPMIALCRRLNDAPLFHNAVLVVIVATAVLMGIETDPRVVASHPDLFFWLHAGIQLFFLVELGIRLIAYTPRVHRFFLDGWNVFDFLVVMVSLLPASGPYAMVARMARLLRVARLISALPELRLLVATMLRSIPSMASIFVLLGLILYIYAVTGVHLFRDADPANWGNLGVALMTLFQVLTLEGWVDLMRVSMVVHPAAWIYYVSFIVVAVFVVVNLFIAVVINNLESAKQAHRLATSKSDPALTVVRDLRERLAELELQLENRR
jgi:voltage-gated sodium channel